LRKKERKKQRKKERKKEKKESEDAFVYLPKQEEGVVGAGEISMHTGPQKSHRVCHHNLMSKVI
jgi:hypothetical protein